MLNRHQIFAAIQEQIGPGATAAPRFAVLLVRVWGLRDIGIRFGYERGEEAVESAQVLIETALRPVDRVFRAGDESFAVLLPSLRNQNHALLAATRLVKAFEEPLNGATSPWQGRAIMGIAFYPEHGGDADILCRRAEIALDEAQRHGEQYAFYQLQASPTEIVYQDLRDALESNRLRVYFQPIWSLKELRVVGVESLARWMTRRQLELSPSDFVPFAEQSNLISALTRWSINTTLRHAAALRDVPGFTVAINLSPRVFVKPGLVEQIIDALRIWGLPTSMIVAEVTETALVHDLDLTVQVLRRLRDEGMRVAIDDFGTGYASISYLARFPATELKIDKSLIGAMRGEPRTEKLVRAVVDLAHQMGMATVAEGIEDQATQDMLIDMDCDYGQGFHLGMPEPARDFVARLTAATATTAAQAPSEYPATACDSARNVQ